MVSTKLCTSCRVTKPLDEFYAGSRTRDGRYPRCRTCRSAASRAYRATLQGRVRTAALKRARYDDGRTALKYARQLIRRREIADMTHHHVGMRAILGPRPAYCLGCFRSGDVQLSLRRSAFRGDNRDLYWGFARSNGERVRYVLSRCPSDYTWHCPSCNAAEGNAVALFDALPVAV